MILSKTNIYRAAIFAFFDLLTIVAALVSLVTAGVYGFCLFKGEKGEEIKEQPTEHDESGAFSGSKKQKKKSLASQDTVV